jgi:hypothetical protein
MTAAAGATIARHILDDAEEYRETLAEGGDAAMAKLVEDAKTTPGVVFEEDTLKALVQLAKSKFPAWVNLRAKLKSEARDVPLAELDKRVKPGSGNGEDGDGDCLAGRPVTFEAIEPWPEPVSGDALLAEIAKTISAYMIMDASQLVAVSLWAVHAHAHDLRDVSPPLVVKSATMRSGKTKLVEVLERLVPKPMYVSGITVSFLERSIEDHHPTLLIDEYDALTKKDPALAEAARAQLNRSARRRGAQVGKNVPLPGGGYEPRLFSTWAATLIAGIGEPPPTIADRAVPIDLKRKMPGETVKPLRDRDGADLGVLKRKIARFVADNEDKIRDIQPAPLAVDNDRAKDMWEPLLAIADIAGGEWPVRVRAAGKALVDASERLLAEINIDVLLLCDIRDIFAEEFPDGHIAHKAETGRPDEGPRLSSKQLLERLHAIEERPWSNWGKEKKPMTGKVLGDRLRPYGIRSGTVRIDGVPKAKGYYLHSFKDAFARYAPTSPNLKRASVTNYLETAENQGKYDNSEASQTSEFVTDENTQIPSNSGVCDACTLGKGGDEGNGGNCTQNPQKSANHIGLTEALVSLEGDI